MDVAGSAVGIASLGIQVCQGLLSYYDGWKEYGADITSARDSVVDLSDTLSLLRESFETGGLDQKRTELVRGCLESCSSGLVELSNKLDELQKYDRPEGLRQKARSKMQRMRYPFRKETLTKLRANVGDVRERLKLALQCLQVATQQSDRFRQITDWLAPPDPWTNRELARRRCEPETGSWLLQSDVYREWKTGGLHHLWLSGKAGCGKTVLSSTVIEDIQAYCKGKENVCLAIFYFSFSDNRKQAYNDLVRSLVAQVGWKEPGLSMLQQAYEKPNRSSPSGDELETILLASLRSYGTVFLVLDALDESPEDDDVRHTALEGIGRLVQSAPNIRMFATSRELREVRESMEALSAAAVSIATSAVDADIRRYAARYLSRDRRLSELEAPTRSLIEEAISRKADGM